MNIQGKYNAMQTAFKQGLITYPRANDKAISEESVACIQDNAKNQIRDACNTS
jgi:DNA topoisomerase IA